METKSKELHLALEYIRDTGCNIFLTGKAGTGKTTFLLDLKKKSPKRLIVTAPTGVAAINAGGVTLHSFFQLPFGPFVPGGENNRSHYRFSKQKVSIIKSLDLLIIDEISMVRADLLDGVDSVLRRYRRNSLPFGGVQLLMIGDLFQLPPVVKESDDRILSQYYDSPYFFSSKSLAKTEMLTIELKHIYRQSDSAFINILNQVRDNSLNQKSLQQLNDRHQPDFKPDDGDEYITLCTHNRDADKINTSRLENLNREAHNFEAEVEGEFPEHTYPTADTLKLKEDAQVMFVRNDISGDKRYYNGKIGRITKISGDDIYIRCPGDMENIVVEPITWENIEYSLDQETLEIQEKKIGEFRQYPLRLAWAITIHKSQGLTFNKAIIDAQAAFAHGQVYVALSRCRTLEGLVLSSPLSHRGIKIDPAILRFGICYDKNPPSNSHLEKAKIEYQQQLLLECFNFQKLRYFLNRLVSLFSGNQLVIQISGVDNLEELKNTTEQEICTVGDNFLKQLSNLFTDSSLPSNDPVILERIGKASLYFEDKIKAGLGNDIPKLAFETDNKDLRKKLRNNVKGLLEEIEVKRAAVKCCETGFSPSHYFQAISAAAINADKKKTPKSSTPLYSEKDIDHPELFTTLREWRAQKAREENLAHFQVMHQKTLVQITVNLPQTSQALLKIKGIGPKIIERYGDDIIKIITTYRRKKGIKEVSLPVARKEKDTSKKTPKQNTREISLEMFEKGLSTKEIASERGMVETTIEGHLAHLIESGRIDCERVLSPEKRQVLQKFLIECKGQQLSEIKSELGDRFSYAEIKYALADQKYIQSLAKDDGE